MLDLDPGAEAFEHTHATLRYTSQSREEGTLWAERLFAQAQPASNDCARFMAGLEA